MVTLARDRPGPLPYFQVRIGPGTSLRTSAPTPLNALVRQGAEVSRPRHRVAPRSSGGILTASPSASPERLGLRVRLTPGRLASPGKPWSYGGGESRPPYRYLCLHLLFMTLQHGSRHTFDADMNAPLPLLTYVRNPRLRYAAYTRLLSTPRSSTSELLRTL